MSAPVIMIAVIAPLNLAVLASGIVIFALGVFGAVRPSAFMAFVERAWATPKGFIIGFVLRVVFGVLLIAAAAHMHYPMTMLALGVIALIKAASIPVLGRAGQQNLIRWWCRHPAHFIRVWSLLVCAFGTFLVLAALPARGPGTLAAAKSARILTASEECRDAHGAIVTKTSA